MEAGLEPKGSWEPGSRLCGHSPGTPALASLSKCISHSSGENLPKHSSPFCEIMGPVTVLAVELASVINHHWASPHVWLCYVQYSCSEACEHVKRMFYSISLSYPNLSMISSTNTSNSFVISSGIITVLKPFILKYVLLHLSFYYSFIL